MRSTLGGAVAPWAPSLLDAADQPAADLAFTATERLELAEGAWVEHQAAWLTGSAAMFDELADGLAWRQPQVLMYGDRVVQPRRSAWVPLDELAGARHLPLAADLVPVLAGALGRRYDRTFRTVGCNLYRDGRDSVAWHGDRVHRERTSSVIAIVSLGAARPFRLRPKGGGTSVAFELGHGDLLVMGGTCQRTWQHAVPKVRRPVGPRLSVTFRHDHPG